MTELQDRKKFLILGGAGKMGRGIALVLLRAYAGDDQFSLTLIDLNADLFPGVDTYLRKHLKDDAACSKVRYATSLAECGPVDLVFEAVIEDVEGKAKLLKEAAQTLGPHPYFFTNTSSIPIHLLGQLSGLSGRLVGFHFYNPPPVQKLVELILPEEASPEIRTFAEELVGKLQKISVQSNDIAGFIGNGHFIREIVSAWEFVERLSQQYPLPQAIVSVDTLTRDWLLRPMGIFQLVDYVGIDVCCAVMKIMREYIPDEDLYCPYLDGLIEKGIRGGQNADGTQKPGILNYTDGKPSGVYVQDKYYPYPRDVLGFPPTELTWKGLVKDPDRSQKIKEYFAKLQTLGSRSAALALELAAQSSAISNTLVETDVARSLSDVETVLQQGFYHLAV